MAQPKLINPVGTGVPSGVGAKAGQLFIRKDGSNNIVDFYFVTADGVPKSFRDSSLIQEIPGMKFYSLDAATVTGQNISAIGSGHQAASFVVDGITVNNSKIGESYLLKNQTTASENGVYQVVGGTGSNIYLERHPAYNTSSELTGLVVILNNGSTQSNTMYISEATSSTIVDTDPLSFSLFPQGFQPLDADLTKIAGLAHSSGVVIYSNGTEWLAAAPGVTSGVQAYDQLLDDISAISFSAAGEIIMWDGSSLVLADAIGVPTYAV
jgi:hypothetical protein